MKYFLALTILLVAGCSTSTAPVSPYSPGGKFYMTTGTFVGTWRPAAVNGNFVDTNLCTAVITEADSIVLGSIMNDSTKEVIEINGSHDDSAAIIANAPDNHFYWIRFVSSLGDTGSSTIDFSTGNGLFSTCQLGQFAVWIDCNRQ
jgi:hypothetical protein